MGILIYFFLIGTIFATLSLGYIQNNYNSIGSNNVVNRVLTEYPIRGHTVYEMLIFVKNSGPSSVCAESFRFDGIFAWNDLKRLDFSCSLPGNMWEGNFKDNGQSTLPLLQYGNKVYYMGIHNKAKWATAMQICNMLHMNLLTISSSDENERIHKYVRDAGRANQYWTGGARFVDDLRWLWMPYGQEVDYTNWSRNQPGRGNEKCLQVWIVRNELTWNDRNCNVELNFICERYLSTTGPSLGL